MSKVERRIGIINASFFKGEVTEITTISITTDGRFNQISTDEMEFTDAMDFIDHIEELHRANTYSAFVMDTYGVNKGIVDAMRNSGLPVISMQSMFLAIDCKISGDIINSTPNLYTPEPQKTYSSDPDGIVAMDGNTYKAIDKMEQRRPRMSISMSLNGENVDIEVL